MPQKLIQEQVQKQTQVQRLSAQQMLQIRLLEMPLTELEASIQAEIDDNPALEASDMEPTEGMDFMDSVDETENFEQKNEREEREEALDSALERMGSDDEIPIANYRQQATESREYEEMVYGDTVSFYDKLNEQVTEHELDDRQRYIIEYLIGSLDDDGLLRKPLDTIADELAIYHQIDCDEKEVEEVLHILQDFDPAGIGARNLQECLLLQIDRSKATDIRLLTRQVLEQHFDAFTKKHWEKIRQAMHLTSEQIADIQKEIHHLNPKPGAAMGETQGRNLQQITPDFIVDTAEDGTISFSLNQGQLPELHVSPSFTEMLAAYKGNKEGMNRQQKEALLYAKEKVDKAIGYIEAVKQRRRTLVQTMHAIIDWQRKFFQDGDESDLKPMILKDISDKTGLDISTISRVSNIKYAQTKWGTFPLRFFFSDGYTTESGEELSTRKMKIALKEIIENEDKKQPMSDEALMQAMRKLGFPIARRTVAKYREQMGLPVARLRKE